MNKFESNHRSLTRLQKAVSVTKLNKKERAQKQRKRKHLGKFVNMVCGNCGTRQKWPVSSNVSKLRCRHCKKTRLQRVSNNKVAKKLRGVIRAYNRLRKERAKTHDRKLSAPLAPIAGYVSSPRITIPSEKTVLAHN
jgi:hypothetical protein